MFGVIVGTASTTVFGQWTVHKAIAATVLLPGLVALHPLMDRPVKGFGADTQGRRFYVGIALVSAAIVLNFWASAA